MAGIEYATWSAPNIKVCFGAPPEQTTKEDTKAVRKSDIDYIDIDSVLGIPAPILNTESIDRQHVIVQKEDKKAVERKKWRKAHIRPKTTDYVAISRYGLDTPIIAVQRGVHTKYPTLVKYCELMRQKTSMTSSELAIMFTDMFKELEQGEFKNFKCCNYGDNAKYIGTNSYDKYDMSSLHMVTPPAEKEMVWFVQVDNMYKKTYEAKQTNIATGCAKMKFENMSKGKIDMAFGDHYWDGWGGNMALTVCDFLACKEVNETMDLIAGFYEMSVLDVDY
jgi:hypothetical protein